jgi:O-antigen biosynthesis protein WbqP
VSWSKRIFDLVMASLLLLLTLPVFIVLAIVIRTTSKGPALYWSDRVGKENRVFKMPKFRSMRINTPQLATHLLPNPDTFITAIGRFLRKTSLDELPQLSSILAGDLSFVGPRPALFNQKDLVALRTARGIHHLVPGLTGWAQVNGRDEIPIPVKVQFDFEYLQRRSFLFDLQIIFITAVKVLRSEGIQH